MNAAELDKKRRAYQSALLNESGKEVLIDLAGFCYSSKPTFDVDPLKMAFKEGRREVWLRIQAYLKLNDDDIWKLFDRESSNE